MSAVDKTITEIDLLAVADAVGVYRSGPVELGPVDPRAGDTPMQRGARQKQARQRATGRHQRSRNVRALDRALDASPYPSAEQYRTRPVAEIARRDATVAELCNQLHALDPEKFTVAYLSERYGITPRSTDS